MILHFTETRDSVLSNSVTNLHLLCSLDFVQFFTYTGNQLLSLNVLQELGSIWALKIPADEIIPRCLLPMLMMMVWLTFRVPLCHRTSFQVLISRILIGPSPHPQPSLILRLPMWHQIRHGYFKLPGMSIKYKMLHESFAIQLHFYRRFEIIVRLYLACIFFCDLL